MQERLNKILVTGAGGYIGTVIVPELLSYGYKVTAVDRFFFGEDKLPDHPNLIKVRTDTRHTYPILFAEVDAVFDLAALSNDPSGDHFPDSTWSINHDARIRNAELAKRCGVKRYLFPSSASVYGFNSSKVKEKASTAPLTHYARANLSAEEDILKLGTSDFCVTVLRQATVYGYSPRMRLDLVLNAMVFYALRTNRLKVMRDGNQWRPFIEINDLAEAFRRILITPKDRIQNRIFNLGHPASNTTIGSVATEVQDLITQKTGKIPSREWYGSPDTRSYALDYGNIEDALSWTPPTDLHSGLSRLIDNIQAVGLQDHPEYHTLSWYQELERNPHMHRRVLLPEGMINF